MKYAFFDVDETLIKFKSMFLFYKYWLAHSSKFGKIGGHIKYMSVLKKIKKASQQHDRAYINTLYYQQYSLVHEDELKAVAKKWWQELLHESDIFHDEVIKHFYYHQKSGYQTVLVSGSFGQCLEPLKKYLRADYGLWTNLEIQAGKLTGKIIGQPTIGEGKKHKILNFLKEQQSECDLENSYAYGDHESDVPMLNLVGNSYMVVNGIPRLRKK